jgi:hypothetical protein
MADFKDGPPIEVLATSAFSRSPPAIDRVQRQPAAICGTRERVIGSAADRTLLARCSMTATGRFPWRIANGYFVL